MVGYNETTYIFDKTLAALKLGTTFTQMINVRITLAIEEGNMEIRTLREELRTLFEMRWNLEFTSNTSQHCREEKR